jgi:hypothetical protein
VLSASTWIENLERLAWPQRLTLLLLLFGGPLNIYLACQRWIERTWRRSYAYKGSVCLLAAIWYVLLVTETIGPGQFIQITRWLQPALILALLISGIQHLAERRQLKRRLELRSALVDQAVRVIEADEEKGW